MSLHMKCHSLYHSYPEIVDAVIQEGDDVTVKGQRTAEVRGALLTFDEPRYSLPYGCGRKINDKIGAAEALQLIGGFSDPEMMARITPNFRRFMDAGIFHGAYGPRLRSQLAGVERRLRLDPCSRQAVVTIWDPAMDNVHDDALDYPCTITLQFMERDRSLELDVYMRSNDVWWGLAYDVFQFTQLQMTMANILKLDFGEYRHHVGSLHCYERDWEKARGLDLPLPRPAYCPPGLNPACAHSTWQSAQRLARHLHSDGKRMTTTSGPYEGEWYADTLKDVLT